MARKFYTGVDLVSQKAINVLDPTSAQDAATKNYVDTRTLSSFGAPTGDLAIGTHKLTGVTDPASAQDAATKNYVDTSVASTTVTSGAITVGALGSTYTPTVGNANVVPLNGWVLLVDSSGNWIYAQVTSGGGSTSPTLTSRTQLVVGGTLGSNARVYVMPSPIFVRLNDVGTPTADVTLASHKLTNVTDPASAQDAATKNYVDTRTLSSFGAPTADLAIGTHKLTGVTDPASAQDAATKNYVDTRTLSSFGAPTADLAIGTHKLTGVTDPASAQDAATKHYVDTTSMPLLTSGTSWPGSPVTGQLFYRTDLNVIGEWTGSVWIVMPAWSTANPPEILQEKETPPGSISTSQTLTPDMAPKTTSNMYLIVCNLSASALTTPTGTGYSLVGNITGNTTQISIYKKEPAGGSTILDAATVAQASGTAIWAMLFEVAGAGAVTGFAGTANAAANQWVSSTIAAARNTLIFAVFNPNASPNGVANGWSLGWSGRMIPSANATGSSPTVQWKLATTASTQLAKNMYQGSTPAGCSCIFGIPAAA